MRNHALNVLTLAAIPLLGASLSAQNVATQVATIPYMPNMSIGPVAIVQNPQLEADQIEYAYAYWEAIDSGGAVHTLMDAFVPSSPDWFGSPRENIDPAPFGDGLQVFEILYAHRLQLNAANGPLFEFQDLLNSDPLVADTWRHWTLTHQIATASTLDPVAHQAHIDAMVEALTTSVEWWTAGIPYFSGDILISDASKKIKRRPGDPLPAPTPIGQVPPPAQAMHLCITNGAGTLAGFDDWNDPNNHLYDSDGGWFGGHVGFDCDDFADAIGYYLVKDKGADYSACTIRVQWTTRQGQSAAHRVAKIKCGDYYWLVDGDTGASSGPFDDNTPPDGRGVIGGYNVDNNRPVRTTNDERGYGSRPSLGEPSSWNNSDAQVRRFERITGLDADCFKPQ